MSATRRVRRLVIACSAVLMTELLCTGVWAQPGGSSIMFKPQPRQDGNAFLVLLAAVTPSRTLAQTDAATGPVPIDLDPAEGAAVIGKLQDLQRRLRRGEKPSFTLLGWADRARHDDRSASGGISEGALRRCRFHHTS